MALARERDSVERLAGHLFLEEDGWGEVVGTGCSLFRGKEVFFISLKTNLSRLVFGRLLYAAVYPSGLPLIALHTLGLLRGKIRRELCLYVSECSENTWNS